MTKHDQMDSAMVLKFAHFAIRMKRGEFHPPNLPKSIISMVLGMRRHDQMENHFYIKTSICKSHLHILGPIWDRMQRSSMAKIPK